MKTKFFLFLIILGFISINITCTGFGGGGCKGERLDVVGIDTIFLLNRNSKGQYSAITKDSIKFDSLFFMISFVENEIASINNFSFLSSARAEPCPPPFTDWDIDSIKVFFAGKDITNQFSVSDLYTSPVKIENSNPVFNEDLQRMLDRSHLRLYFRHNIPPVKTESCQYNFQFFDKKGRMFEKMSEPIVITP